MIYFGLYLVRREEKETKEATEVAADLLSFVSSYQGYKNINMLSIRLYDFLKDSGHDKQMNDFPPFAGSCCLY